jgi:hypothetical protein
MAIAFMFSPGYCGGWLLFFAILSWVSPIIFLVLKCFFRANTKTWSTGYKMVFFFAHLTNTLKFIMDKDEDECKEDAAQA